MAVNNNILPINSLNDLRPESRHTKETQLTAHKQAVATIKSFEEYLMAVAGRAQEEEQGRVGLGRNTPLSLQDMRVLQKHRISA